MSKGSANTRVTFLLSLYRPVVILGYYTRCSRAGKIMHDLETAGFGSKFVVLLNDSLVLEAAFTVNKVLPFDGRGI